jgi:hypothetical protein
VELFFGVGGPRVPVTESVAFCPFVPMLLWLLFTAFCGHGGGGTSDEEPIYPVGQLGARRCPFRKRAFEAAFAAVLGGRTVKDRFKDDGGGDHLSLLTHLDHATTSCSGISHGSKTGDRGRRSLGKRRGGLFLMLSRTTRRGFATTFEAVQRATRCE